MIKLKKNKKWNLAKRIIPGGNMLISKRSEFILPEFWPAYYNKANDCYVWDLDKNKYLDMFFSPGTNILGYCNKQIDNKIIKAVKKSNMSSLNSYKEVLLAKKLVSYHKWSDMVKFARTGGEANAVAIRIARAASKNKKNIAFCGYHGWHDWYMSSALNKKENLKTHLIKGIDSSGLPEKLKNTAFPFEYNNIEMLENLVKKKNIGIIKMEVQRNFNSENNFLQKVRNLCTKKNIILIFDECTSGFRESLGGIHLNHKVNPDMMILGKALGNGYPITAVLGKRKLMKCANKTFISSTFWTENLGYVAALETLKYMEKNKTYLKLKKTGKHIKFQWKKIALKHNLEIKVTGIDAIPSFNFIGDFNQKAITYITQEMLKNNILATNVIYISIAHKKNYVNRYLKQFDVILGRISKLKNKNNLSKLIKGKERQSQLQRYN